VPVFTPDTPPGQTRYWSPIATTLISGKHEAVLVDPLMTIEQGRALADWVAATGKHLTTVYITHGHGDHWFGLALIRERFPHVRAIALPEVVDSMRQQASPQEFKRFWEPFFPGQLPQDLTVADPLSSTTFELEGNELVALNVGHTDTDNTTVLNVPSIGLVVAGDAAYNDVHLYLAESNHDSRLEWITALDTIEQLQPRTVVASHQRAGRGDEPGILEETRQYIRDFDRLALSTSTARELYEDVLALHPNRINPGALWRSAWAVKGRTPG